MNEIKIFENEQFGQIRTIEIDGEPHFVASDVAKALGYVRPNDAVSAHCRYTVKRRIPHPQSKTKTLEANCIPIGDVFRLGTHSELPGAEQFESWVYDEVLPTLHKTGKYEMPKKGPSQDERAQAMKMNAKSRMAGVYLKLANAETISPEYKAVLVSKAAETLAGEQIIPLPKLERKTYSATEIGKELGITSHKVGRLTEAHKLKTEEYGMWVHDKAKYADKQVPSFRYYDNIIPVLSDILEQH